MAAVDLSGKIALITGASRGIGAAVAKAYAAAGAHVILLARDVKKLEQVDDTIRAQGGQATLLPLDLSQLDDVDRIGPTLHDKFGGLDIVVGNAARLGTLSPLTHIKAREFDTVFRINVTANFHLIRTLDPLLQQSKAGRAIFVTTSHGVVYGRAYWGSYAISKAALESMVRVYASEVAQTPIRVNMINPGAVRTDMRAAAIPGENPMTLPAPEEVAPAFLELVSDTCNKHGEIVSVSAK